jgi:hypothetical protein
MRKMMAIRTALPNEDSRPMTTPFTVDSWVRKMVWFEVEGLMKVERWLERKAWTFDSSEKGDGEERGVGEERKVVWNVVCVPRRWSSILRL